MCYELFLILSAIIFSSGRGYLAWMLNILLILYQPGHIPQKIKKISKLTSVQLKLKEVETPTCFNSRVINVLEDCNI